QLPLGRDRPAPRAPRRARGLARRARAPADPCRRRARGRRRGCLDAHVADRDDERRDPLREPVPRAPADAPRLGRPHDGREADDVPRPGDRRPERPLADRVVEPLDQARRQPRRLRARARTDVHAEPPAPGRPPVGARRRRLRRRRQRRQAPGADRRVRTADAARPLPAERPVAAARRVPAGLQRRLGARLVDVHVLQARAARDCRRPHRAARLQRRREAGPRHDLGRKGERRQRRAEARARRAPPAHDRARRLVPDGEDPRGAHPGAGRPLDHADVPRATRSAQPRRAGLVRVRAREALMPRAVEVARTFADVERLAARWDAAGWTREEAERPMLVARTQSRPEAVAPFGVVVSDGDETAGALAARIDRRKLAASFGYKTVVAPQVRLLHVIDGGIWLPDAAAVDAAVGAVREALERREVDAVALPYLPVDSPVPAAAADAAAPAVAARPPGVVRRIPRLTQPEHALATSPRRAAARSRVRRRAAGRGPTGAGGSRAPLRRRRAR